GVSQNDVLDLDHKKTDIRKLRMIIVIFKILLLFGSTYAQVNEILREGCGYDILWVFDTSCSISEANKNIVKEFIKEVADNFKYGTDPDQTLMSVLTYDRGFEHQFFFKDALTDSKFKERAEEIDLQYVACKTHTWKALKQARRYFTPENGGRMRSTDVIILITDGVTLPRSKAKKTIREAKKLRQSGFEIFVFALPNQFGHSGLEELKLLASDSVEKRLFTPNSFAELPDFVKQLKRSICNVDVLEESSRVFQAGESVFTSLLCPNGFYNETNKESCQIPRSGCDVRNKRCCGCGLAFAQPDNGKTPMWPSTILRLNSPGKKCICESCLIGDCIPPNLRKMWTKERRRWMKSQKNKV
ncbi:unnamed protein product, partial [Owenia fusiformis]